MRLIVLSFLMLSSVFAFAQAPPVNQLADSPTGGLEGAVAFSIGSDLFVGLGKGDAADFYKSFYRFRAATNQWVQVADFPGAARSNAVAFTIGDRAYVGLGESFVISGGFVYTFYNDLYEYNASSNNWTAAANFPGDARSKSYSFAIDNAGYVGGGANEDTIYDDQYKFENGAWTSSADLSMWGVRFEAFSFVLNGKAYVGGGSSSGAFKFSDMNEYDPVANAWSRPFANAYTELRTSSAAAFSWNGKGYIFYGTGGKLVEFDVTTGTATDLGDALGLGGARNFPFAVNVEANGALVGHGRGGSPARAANDIFLMGNIISSTSELPLTAAQIFPTVTEGSLTIDLADAQLNWEQVQIFNSNGQLMQTRKLVNGTQQLSLNNAPTGIYFVQLQAAEGVHLTKVIKQ